MVAERGWGGVVRLPLWLPTAWFLGAWFLTAWLLGPLIAPWRAALPMPRLAPMLGGTRFGRSGLSVPGFDGPLFGHMRRTLASRLAVPPWLVCGMFDVAGVGCNRC